MSYILEHIIGFSKRGSFGHFSTGMGSAFNLGGNYFEVLRMPSNPSLDHHGIQSDWNKVGKDILFSVDSFIELNPKAFSK